MNLSPNLCNSIDDEDDSELAQQIREHNKYMMAKLRAIMEFDVWYEHTTGKDFPSEWYGKVRRNGTK
jgi:hypothetical protein